jgi:hypothetical protein
MDFRSLIQSLDTIKESVQQPAVQIINDFDEVVAKFDHVPKGFRDAFRSSEFDAVQWLADVMKNDPDFDITTIEKIVLAPGVSGYPDEYVIDVTEYLDALDESIHKGTYGTSYGKEDVRDQYGHRVGKVNKGAEATKDEPKKGRGRPKKGAGTSGEHKTYDTTSLGSVFGGGKKPSKEVGKKSVKHSLKEYIEEAESALNEDASVGVKPLPGASEITMNNEPTGITAKDPQSATKIKDLMATGSISMPGENGSNGVNNSLGEDGFDDEHSGHDPAEYDMEGDFVKTQLHTIARSTRDLEERISDQEDLPEWVEMKISQAQGMLASVSDYMDSQHERDVERETGEEEMVSEKAKSKAQQRFFGMVHAMQKGKKVPGASSELKGVAKDIGKKDAKDFAKTKHKGLPNHVDETSFEDHGVSEESKGLWANIHAKRERIKNGSGEHMRKPGSKGAPTASALKKSATEDVAEGFPRIQKGIQKYTQKEKKVKESTYMKITQLTEGAMKDLLINFHNEVHSHMGDGSMFDLKKANNLQQAEEILKALVKHGDEYEGLNITNQNELVSQAMKSLAHEKELPFNTFAGVDKQRFVTKSPADLSKYRQHPATPTSLFNRPGSSMAEPRTAVPTIKESNDMKDKQFESWEQELNSLLIEGITVSHSTGQQGSPDSLSINATEHDAGELMSILRNSGMEMFGGSKEQNGGYGAPEHNGGEDNGEFHQGIEIAPSPEVVGDGDDMLALIKKMSGIETDSNTPGSVEVDYEDEEGNDEDHGEECDDCGHSPCSCDDEGEEELSELTAEHPGGETPLPEGDMEEGNEFSGELAKAKAQHKDHFNVDGKEYPVKEGDMEEGNAFTGKLKQTPKGGEFKMGDKSYKDTSSIEENGAGAGDEEESLEEGAEDCMECGYPMESCACDHVEEGYANDAGGDAMGDTELLQLKELLGRGNDLHRQKHTQATGNIQKVTMETKLLKDTTELLTDWKKLSGIK